MQQIRFCQVVGSARKRKELAKEFLKAVKGSANICCGPVSRWRGDGVIRGIREMMELRAEEKILNKKYIIRALLLILNRYNK